MTGVRPEWTTEETAVLTAAARGAPSVHGTQPWVLEIRGRDVLVIERVELRLPRHDPAGRDRLISCGAAVANLRVAVRRLGLRETWRQFPDPGRRDVVAAVHAGERLPTTPDESARYTAMRRRHSHRTRFAGPPDPHTDLLHATDVAGVAVVPLAGPAADAALARLLAHTAAVIGRDAAYRRELAAWTGPASALPLWLGLGCADGALPEHRVLADRLGDEAHLVVITVGDGPSDHLRAGVALEQTWLAAAALGLAASAVTQPLHLPEVRAGLIEAAELPGYPQAILRVGKPADVPHPLLQTSGKAR